MKLLTVKEKAKDWNISERSVRNYCNHKRVEGAILKGKTWYIPSSASLPERKNRISNKIYKVLLEEKKHKIKGGLYHKTQIDFAFNSNHMEGSTLTKDQTIYIYETNTIGMEKDSSIKVDDIIETINHFKCFDKLLETLSKPLDEKLIKLFHKILKSNTSDASLPWIKVGNYKLKPNFVGDQPTTLPEDVKKDIKNLLKWYSSIKNISLEDIIEFHVKFEKIHPFQDGNGRVGRLIMFRECLRNNIVPFIITDDIRMFYYRGLKEWNKQKGYLTDTCLKCQDDYKALLLYLRIKY